MGEGCKLYRNKVRETDAVILLANRQALYTSTKSRINYLISILLLFLPPLFASAPIQVCISAQVSLPKDGTKVQGTRGINCVPSGIFVLISRTAIEIHRRTTPEVQTIGSEFMLKQPRITKISPTSEPVLKYFPGRGQVCIHRVGNALAVDEPAAVSALLRPNKLK